MGGPLPLARASWREPPRCLARPAPSSGRDASVIASAGPQSVKRAYGGPAPFGVGLGVVELEAASAEHAGRVATATARREQRQAFAALVQDASLPLPTGMTEAERADVAERRLRRRLAKFWGLLNEAGRPWQRSLILRLCDELPRDACKSYRRLTASKLQRIIAARCRVESEMRKHVEDARWQASQARRRLQQQQQQQLSEARLQAMQLQQRVADTAALLDQQADRARRLNDDDYLQYSRPLGACLDELRAFCRALRALLLDASDDGGQGEGSSEESLRRGSGGGRGSLFPGSDAAADVGVERQKEGDEEEVGGRRLQLVAAAASRRQQRAERTEARGGGVDGASYPERWSREGVGGGGDSGRSGAASLSGRPRAAVAAQLQPVPLPAVEWRYPPGEYVLVKRKGLPGLHPLVPPKRGATGAGTASALRLSGGTALGGGYNQQLAASDRSVISPQPPRWPFTAVEAAQMLMASARPVVARLDRRAWPPSSSTPRLDASTTSTSSAASLPSREAVPGIFD